MRETYPSLKAQAKAEDAEIGWVDETTAKTKVDERRSFAPKGKTPGLRQLAQCFPGSIMRLMNHRKLKKKPAKARSPYAVTGLYSDKNDVVDIAHEI